MQCNNCGTENPQNAVFCKHCGKRFDGMSACGFCGRLTPADGEFCINCGANRNAPVYIMRERVIESTPVQMSKKSAVAEVAVERPVQRAAVVEVAVDQPVQKAECASVSDENYASCSSKIKPELGRIFGIISFACASAAALLAMIFVFVIGNTVSTSGGSANTGIGGYNLFFFFGDVYKTDTLLGGSNTFAAACGTVLVALSLAATLACFIFAIVRFILILKKRTQKSMIAPAAATVIAYVCSAALFNLCLAEGASSMGVSVGMAPNGATIAGLVLCALFMVAAVALKAVRCGMGGNVRAYVSGAVCQTLVAVFVFVALGAIGSGIAFCKVGSLNGTASLGIVSLFNSIDSGADIANYVNTYNTCLALTAVALVAVVALCVFAVLSLADIISSFGRGVAKKTFVFTILTGGFAVLYGILSCVISASYASFTSMFEIDVAVPVVVMLFGLFVVAASITNVVLSKKFATKE